MSSAEASAARLVRFLETGEVTAGLFTDDVFCDFTLPLWRLQAEGVTDVVALRRSGHPGPGRVIGRRCDSTERGFVLEIEESWEDKGETWYCRELIRCDLRGDSIEAISVYCTGDWTAARVSQHARDVRLLRV